MGLIKAFVGSTFSYIGDMWEDYIYCDALDNDTLVQRGHAKRSPGAGNNKDDNVITQGSRIAVNAGQMLIIVENGAIIDFTAEQGGYIFNSATEPSCFMGGLSDAVRVSFEEIKARFAFGGIAGKDQRAYFINTKEIINNKFGFGKIPYRDSEFDMTITLQGYGTFSYKIDNPILFYSNISGNVKEKYSRAALEPQLKAELQDAMLAALSDLARAKVRYDEIPSKGKDLALLLNEKTRSRWKDGRGVELATISFSNIIPDDESMDKIRDLQESRVYSENKAMLGARVGAAQANAMEAAADNSAGAVTGFMGMNMAQNAGGVNVAELMKDAPSKSTSAKEADSKDAEATEEAEEDKKWFCPGCGMENHMAFCPKCGTKKPEEKSCPGCGFIIPKEYEGFAFCPKCGSKL